MSTMLRETEETLAHSHVLCVLDRNGDTKVMWNEDNADEVANAKRTFDDLVGKGYMAYRTDKKGAQGEQMRKFDPAAERMILIPAMAGG